MEFESDPEKSRLNAEKHGIDFDQAQELWSDPRRLIVEARSETEPRFAIIAELHGRLWTGIFTLRDTSIRIISVRRSRHGEKEGYYHR